jgi:hypothetical protein
MESTESKKVHLLTFPIDIVSRLERNKVMFPSTSNLLKCQGIIMTSLIFVTLDNPPSHDITKRFIICDDEHLSTTTVNSININITSENIKFDYFVDVVANIKKNDWHFVNKKNVSNNEEKKIYYAVTHKVDCLNRKVKVRNLASVCRNSKKEIFMQEFNKPSNTYLIHKAPVTVVYNYNRNTIKMLHRNVKNFLNETHKKSNTLNITREILYLYYEYVVRSYFLWQDS